MNTIVLTPFFHIGRVVIFVGKRGNLFLKYFSDFLWCLVTPPFRKRETIQQMYHIGVKSAPIILFSLSFAAAVTILEYAYHMKLVIQTAAMVPGFAALLIIRELGAVITALLLTSKVGAGITAEVGTMKITEQIEALQMLNVDPMRYLVIPRFVASILSTMALVVFANATCLLFAMIMSLKYINTSPEVFLSSMNSFAHYKDFVLSVIKGACFGAVIPVISCFYGFQCRPGAEGVGDATTKSVVSNAVTIILLDFVLTYLFTYL